MKKSPGDKGTWGQASVPSSLVRIRHMKIVTSRVLAGAAACVALAVAIPAFPQVRSELHRLAGQHIARLRPVKVNDPIRPMLYRNLDGGPITLGTGMHGTYVYNVFTTWCPSCREELPAFADMARKLQRRGVKVYGIDQGESPETVRAFTQANALPFETVLDSDRTSNSVLGANMIPTTVIVRDGVVVATWSGPLSPAGLTALLKSAT